MHARQTLKPAVAELNRFTQMLHDTLREEFLRINENHMKRLQQHSPGPREYQDAMMKNSQLFEKVQLWKEKYMVSEGRIRALLQQNSEQWGLCRRLSDEKSALERKIASWAEDAIERSTTPGERQDLDRRVEVAVSRRTISRKFFSGML